MKVIVNAAPLCNISTGIGRYLKSVYTQISHQYPEIQISYFNGVDISDVMPTPPDSNSLWSTAVKIAWHLPPFVPYLARVLNHERSAKKFFKLSKGFDIYHEAGYFPFKAAENVKTIFMIHDISLKILPDFHPKDRVLFFERYFERALPSVDAVITPSMFTEKEIRKTFPEMNAGIHSIYLGFDKTLFFKRSKNEVDMLKEKLNLPEKFILFVGTSDPRKNIKAIINAFAQLPASVTLVCAGWSGWDGKGTKQFAENLKDRIIFTGYVSDLMLAALYSGARAFVYPSFYEGFGLPVLEAMACGCPVICSNTASLPEVAGNAAVFCDPHDSSCLADAILQIFSSDDIYTKMSLQSLRQAEKFTWEKTAQGTVRVFERTR